MPLALHDLRKLQNVLGMLVLQAREENERKLSPRTRYEFARPLSVTLDDGRRYAAISRDVSASGIGLSHDMGLVPGDVEISIAAGWDNVVRLTARLMWCRACEDGTFVSGGRVLSLPAARQARQ